MDRSGANPAAEKIPQSGFDKVKSGVTSVNRWINRIGMILFRLRKIVLAAPVVYYALKMAAYNGEHLPEQVGLNLQSTGEFAMTVARSMAVMGPLALTGVCLLMMFFSRKALYPWAISVFTLALPVLLLISNLYPA